MIKPLGNYVLIEPEKIETTYGETKIILQDDTAKKEHAIKQTGKVIAIGPTAFKRWKGCESPRWLTEALSRYAKNTPSTRFFEAICDFCKWEDPDYPPHKQWGIKIGDIVEHRKYNAMDSTEEGFEHIRYIPDIEILGVITDE